MRAPLLLFMVLMSMCVSLTSNVITAEFDIVYTYPEGQFPRIEIRNIEKLPRQFTGPAISLGRVEEMPRGGCRKKAEVTVIAGYDMIQKDVYMGMKQCGYTGSTLHVRVRSMFEEDFKPEELTVMIDDPEEGTSVW
jgi:hypothetical protein